MSRSIPTEDRISSLEDSILCHILSFLSTKFAATTSVLSKRWNPLWLSVPALYFDDEEFKDKNSFSRFVSSVFLLRNIMLPLQSFSLICSTRYKLKYEHDISQFVQAALQRGGIENFTLEIDNSVWLKAFELPPSIFSCKTLVFLNLTGVTVKDDFSLVIVDLPRLKTLYLPCLRTRYLSKLLSGCPVLEDLHVRLVPYIGNAVQELDNWINPPIVPECLSAQLKTCFLYLFRDTECEIQLAKYIMQNSKVLNTMSIYCPHVDIDDKYDMLKKLALSRRASTTCELILD